MKSGRPGALKPVRLGLSCKANKCSDTRTGDLGVLTSPCFALGDAGLTHLGRVPPQIQVRAKSRSTMALNVKMDYNGDNSPCVNESVHQGWAVDWTKWSNRGGIVSTPLPIKLLPLASPWRHLD